MALETINGNLLGYKGLEPGSFQHVDQLTTKRRTNHGLRSRAFYTADGELYTVQRRKHLWAITREPQNLVLQNIDEAYRQLTGQGNYFPDAETARASLSHEDTVIVEHEGLKLERGSDKYSYFVIDPKNVRALNSQRRIAAQRIYGPDEDNFGLNMEMFARARKHLCIFVLMPEYVRRVLRKSDQRFLMQASSLSYFQNNSNFYANEDYVSDLCALSGIRKIAEASREGSHERSDLSDAPKVAGKQPLSERSETTANIVIPFPQENRLESSGVVTLERMLETS